MKIGFGKSDITPRVGVQLAGFGPFRNRHSNGIRDNLWARAIAFENNGSKVVIVSCDLTGVVIEITDRVREIVSRDTGIFSGAIMVTCTHTHSAPSTGTYKGWGEADPPYLEVLPARIAQACIDALNGLEEAELSHAEVPCEGIGVNREYDQLFDHGKPIEHFLTDEWRPDKPELTDTTCHVLKATRGGEVIGFVSYFACHPVVCCEETFKIHGDFVGVATNNLEKQYPGSIGLFLQGAQGDVNSCVAHYPEPESMRALDIIADRYASAVQRGIETAEPVSVDEIVNHRDIVTFTRKDWGLDKLRALLAEREAFIHQPGATDSLIKDGKVLRMEMVYAIALREFIAKAERGEDLALPTEIHGIRIGPICLIGSGFEVYQATKNLVLEQVPRDITLLVGFTNDRCGYAPDDTVAERGGYTVDMTPFICRQLPYANIHQELTKAFVWNAQNLE